MEHMYPNIADTSEKKTPSGSGVDQDGKAYKLIKLNYDIVIIVRTVDPGLLPRPLLTKYARSMIPRQ